MKENEKKMSNECSEHIKLVFNNLIFNTFDSLLFFLKIQE